MSGPEGKNTSVPSYSFRGPFYLAFYATIGWGTLLNQLNGAESDLFFFFGMYALAEVFQQILFGNRYLHKGGAVEALKDTKRQAMLAGRDLDLARPDTEENQTLAEILAASGQAKIRLFAGLVLGICLVAMVTHRITFRIAILFNFFTAVTIVMAMNLNHLLVPLGLNIVAVIYGSTLPTGPPAWALLVYAVEVITCFIFHRQLELETLFPGDLAERKGKRVFKAGLAAASEILKYGFVVVLLLMGLDQLVGPRFHGETVPDQSEEAGKHTRASGESTQGTKKDPIREAVTQVMDAFSKKDADLDHRVVPLTPIPLPSVSPRPNEGLKAVYQKLASPRPGVVAGASPTPTPAPSIKPDPKAVPSSTAILGTNPSPVPTPSPSSGSPRPGPTQSATPTPAPTQTPLPTATPTATPTGLSQKGVPTQAKPDQNLAPLQGTTLGARAQNSASASQNSGRQPPPSQNSAPQGSASQGSAPQTSVRSSSNGATVSAGAQGASSGSGAQSTAQSKSIGSDKGPGGTAPSPGGSSSSSGGAGPNPGGGPGGGLSWWGLMTLALLLLGFLIALAFWYRRRKRVEEHGPRMGPEHRRAIRLELARLKASRMAAREEVVARYRVFLLIMEAVDAPRAHHVTPAEFALGLRSIYPGIWDEATVLTELFSDVFYGDIPPADDRLAYARVALDRAFAYFC